MITCLLLCLLAPAAAAQEARLQVMEKVDFRKVVAGAKDQVFPAVIFVKCVRAGHETGKKLSQEVSGSGVIISPTGEAITNWHVVDKAVEVRVLLYDGRHYDAEVIGSDKDTDLALIQLKIKEGEQLPVAGMGKAHDLKEGDFVMAMGAPWGMSRSVSIGIVSCTRRYLPGNSEYSLWLQTDAAISPGNSGGPLVNTEGQVIGLNTRGVIYGGDMGFSIPSETIRVVVSQLRDHGKMNWSWTGLNLQPLRDFDKDMYFEGSDGVIVADTDPESPARRAGIRPRDRILEIDGKAVSAVTSEDLPSVRRKLGLLEKGENARLKVRRNGESLIISITPREKGAVEGEELDCPRWDFTVKAINQFDNPDLYFHRKVGVFVYGVEYPGNASSAGLRRNDIILKIDGKTVETLDDVKGIYEAAVENIDEEQRMVFTLLRSGLMRQVVLDYSRDYERE